MGKDRNYQKELDKILEDIGADPACAPTLFIHSCCAPCSSYVLEYLRRFFRITVFYYNPNISMEEEYRKRAAEQKRLIAACNSELENEIAEGKQQNVRPAGHPIGIVEGDYEPDRFYEIAKGLEQCPEGGERCFACYELRLRRTAACAAAEKYDYYATTLTVSPLKNAAKLNELGEKLAKEYVVSWLPSDFKKKGGYQRSIELSEKYALYRQDYCGCIYSQEERRRIKEERRRREAEEQAEKG